MGLRRLHILHLQPPPLHRQSRKPTSCSEQWNSKVFHSQYIVMHCWNLVQLTLYTFLQRVPSEFARKFLPAKSTRAKEMILKTEHGSFVVQYRFHKRFKGWAAELGLGWERFAQANKLHVNDILDFELDNLFKQIYRVKILRFFYYTTYWSSLANVVMKCGITLIFISFVVT